MDDKVNSADGEPRDTNLASKELDSLNVSVHSPYISDAEEKENEANPFKDPKTLAHWQQVYENASYECRHMLDPDLEWTAKEEKRLVWKLDWKARLSWACIMFFSLQTDRGNLSQAVSDNMLKELHLSTDDYNTGNTINLVALLCAEIPSQLISKKVGPDRWIPTQMVLWSIVAGSQAAMPGKAGFYTTRVLLGVLQGGFIPDLVLWLSYFYKSNELSLRLSFFWTAEDLTSVVTSLLALALLHLDGVDGLSGWRWLFLIEALITLTVGIAAFFLMPASAVATKTCFRPKGWFTDREVGIVVNRALRDDPSKGDMHNRMAITPKRLWKALCDYDLWPIYAMGLVVFIPIGSPTTYLTLSLRNIGFSPFNTNLLTIPSTVASCFTLIGLTWLSEYVGERSLIASLQNIWVLPCLIALRVWSGTEQNAWGTFALITVLLSYPYCHSILVAWASRNSGSVKTRSVSAATYNMMVQLGNIVAANIYRSNDAPVYRTGKTVLIVIDVISILMFPATKLYYMWRNKRRERVWNGMSEEERRVHLEGLGDSESKRLDFRFVH